MASRTSLTKFAGFAVAVAAALVMGSSSARADDPLNCSKGRIRHRELPSMQYVYENSEYCTSPDFNVLMSPNCRDEVKKPCKARDWMKRPGVTKLEPEHRPDANPGFLLCKALGAMPQLIDFEIAGDWHDLDRCVFDDKSFVDTSVLVGMMNYLKRKK